MRYLDILVVAVRRLSRRWKPYQPYEAGIITTPISNTQDLKHFVHPSCLGRQPSFNVSTETEDLVRQLFDYNGSTDVMRHFKQLIYSLHQTNLSLQDKRTALC